MARCRRAEPSSYKTNRTFSKIQIEIMPEMLALLVANALISNSFRCCFLEERDGIVATGGSRGANPAMAPI